jgi:hypothetical protein
MPRDDARVPGVDERAGRVRADEAEAAGDEYQCHPDH